MHASGFAAVYACSLMLGNAQLPHRAATRSFVEGIGWIAQIGLFVMLGLLALPERVTPNAALTAVAAGLSLTFIARPISVAVSALPFKLPPREQVFLSWAGLRGAVLIGLATIPLADQIGGAEFLFDVVLVFVIIFTCLQAPTLPIIARRLGPIDDDEAQEVEVEAAPLDKISADLLQVRIPAALQAGRRRDRRTAASQAHRRLADHPRRPPLRPGRTRTDQGGGRVADRHPGSATGEHRAADPCLGPRRPARSLARGPLTAGRVAAVADPMGVNARPALAEPARLRVRRAGPFGVRRAGPFGVRRAGPFGVRLSRPLRGSPSRPLWGRRVGAAGGSPRRSRCQASGVHSTSCRFTPEVSGGR